MEVKTAGEGEDLGEGEAEVELVPPSFEPEW